MKRLSQINVKQLQETASIQLFHGDLSAIPPKYATDILVMSAFPGNYIALKGSLIKALEDKGLSVEALARDKETDLRSSLNCWLSKPLSPPEQQKFNFKKILCFEPGEKIKEPEEVVGDIFRCINSFAFDEDNNELAMPIIGTGYQQVSLDKMLPALLTACHFWLSNGLPLQNIKLVVHDKEKADLALGLFNAFKKSIPKKAVRKLKNIKKTGNPKGIPDKRYHYFLSYAHTHSKDIQLFVEELRKRNNQLSIFYDKDSIPPGGLWIQQISTAIQQADKVLVFLSPDYDNSPVCWDEFQCAKLMEYNLKKTYDPNGIPLWPQRNAMPLIMGIYSYIDCREGNQEKLKQCVEALIK